MYLKNSFWGLIFAVLLSVPALAQANEGEPAYLKAALLNGGDFDLSQHRGKIVMINFWATWCGPCREEMPHLQALYERYQSLGFTLLGVNVEEDSENAAAWLEETPVTFPILFDSENLATKLYDVVAMPSTVLIDRNGGIRFIHHGYQPGYEDEYQAQIRALIRE